MSEGKTPEAHPKAGSWGGGRVPGAGLSGAAHAAPAQGGAFDLSGLRRALPPPVMGATPHAGTGQSLLGGFGRAGFAEDAAGGRGGDGQTWPLFKTWTRTYCNICGSLFGFFLF